MSETEAQHNCVFKKTHRGESLGRGGAGVVVFFLFFLTWLALWQIASGLSWVWLSFIPPPSGLRGRKKPKRFISNVLFPLKSTRKSSRRDHNNLQIGGATFDLKQRRSITGFKVVRSSPAGNLHLRGVWRERPHKCLCLDGEGWAPVYFPAPRLVSSRLCRQLLYYPQRVCVCVVVKDRGQTKMSHCVMTKL